MKEAPRLAREEPSSPLTGPRGREASCREEMMQEMRKGKELKREGGEEEK